MADSLCISSKQLSVFSAKRIRLLAVAALIAAGTVASLDAEARRMGGGRTIGRQSQSLQKPATPPAQQSLQQSTAQPAQRAQTAPAAQPTPAAPSARSRWLGPLAGLAAGLGIAALLSHFGLGGAFASAMANVIVVALLAMVGIWLVRKIMGSRRRDATPAYGAAGAGALRSAPGIDPYQAPSQPAYDATPPAAAAAAAPAVPAGFDADAFLHHAKVNFVRLQTAWDDRNLADLREFTTPEMFAELKVDMDSRADERNQTDVVRLDAALLALEDRGSEYFASVRFSGLIRETAGGAAELFAEVWNLTKVAGTSEGWLLAGIEQVAPN
ncbi:Tim44 domain-containing protein [Trinickia fusca]|uniref:Tim44 domain-containing protein n=1 Tax=Trinickia fusca TaxID=2419777 RepID=A0A494XM80_9BURK|nr:TIM44-like domain-containing protein [Trinickia fusca]RKP49174.1 Tim44 domain-containing protein [Trinickia fusca]